MQPVRFRQTEHSEKLTHDHVVDETCFILQINSCERSYSTVLQAISYSTLELPQSYLRGNDQIEIMVNRWSW